MEELIKETENEKSKFPINMFAVLLAFVMGLTFGSVKKDVNLKIRSSSSKSNSTISPAAEASAVTSVNTEESDLASACLTSDAYEDYYPMYKTPTGRKYHFNAECAGENRIKTNYDEALLIGLTPCKKCADG